MVALRRMKGGGMKVLEHRAQLVTDWGERKGKKRELSTLSSQGSPAGRFGDVPAMAAVCIPTSNPRAFDPAPGEATRRALRKEGTVGSACLSSAVSESCPVHVPEARDRNHLEAS